MEPVKINNIPAYYIGKTGENILIVEENSHFLECPYTLWENIMPLVKGINKEEIPVYIIRPNFDKTDFTYHQIIFLKSKENINVYSGKDISFEELPKSTKELFKRFKMKKYSPPQVATRNKAQKAYKKLLKALDKFEKDKE